MPSNVFVTLLLNSVNAEHLRSNNVVLANGPTDTDYIMVSAVPTVDAAQTVNNGPIEFSQGDVFTNDPGTVGPILLGMGAPATFNYVVTNNGHSSQSDVDAALTKAGTALGQKGVQAALTAIESAAGAGAGVAVAGAGASLGSVVLPIIGSIVGAVAGWLLSEGFSLFFADCDGVVAVEQFSQDINQLWLYTNGSPGFQQVTDHPGTPSPDGCGGNSHYIVTWSLALHWLNSACHGAPRALIRLQNHLDVFWPGADGTIQSAWLDSGQANDNNGPWSAPFAISGTDSFPGLISSVIPYARAQSHIDVFWISSEGAVKSAWYDWNVNNGAWNAEFEIAPPSSASPQTLTAISRVPTHMDLFWVSGTDGSIQTAWWDQGANNGAWNPAFAIAPAGSAEIGYTPAVLARAPTHLDVFWVSGDGSVRSVWWDQGINNANWDAWFNVAPAGSATVSPISALARIPTHMDVFWIGPDGSVRTAWWDQNQNSAAWNAQFNIAPPGSAATAVPVSVVARTPNHIDLFWVGPDGSVLTSYWDVTTPNFVWSPVITLAPGGSALISIMQGLAVVAPTAATVYAFWIAPDGSVMAAWHDDAGGADSYYYPSRPIVPAGNALTNGPALTAQSRSDQHIDLFWVGPDHSMRTAWWDYRTPGSRWSAPLDISGAGTVGGIGGY